MVVFDHLDADAFIPEKVSKRVQQMQWMANQLGEPMKSGFNPHALLAHIVTFSTACKIVRTIAGVSLIPLPMPYSP
jgi:hypothetical protein